MDIDKITSTKSSIITALTNKELRFHYNGDLNKIFYLNLIKIN